MEHSKTLWLKVFISCSRSRTQYIFRVWLQLNCETSEQLGGNIPQFRSFPQSCGELSRVISGNFNCFLRLTVDVQNPSGIGMSIDGDEMFIRIANFSLWIRRFEDAGPSANCWGVRVRNRIFLIASRSVGCIGLLSDDTLAAKTTKTFQNVTTERNDTKELKTSPRKKSSWTSFSNYLHVTTEKSGS